MFKVTKIWAEKNIIPEEKSNGYFNYPGGQDICGRKIDKSRRTHFFNFLFGQICEIKLNLHNYILFSTKISSYGMPLKPPGQLKKGSEVIQLLYLLLFVT